MEKKYLAYVQGKPEEKKGRLVNEMEKDSRTNTSRVVEKKTSSSKRAELDYCVLKETEEGSLVEIHLHTGRHHQIRVQTSHHGAPIWGDRKYNTLQPMRGVGNMALWSWKLEGKWEKQKEGFSIRSLPSDMPFSLFSEKLGEL